MTDPGAERIDRLVHALRRRFPQLPNEDAGQYIRETLLSSESSSDDREIIGHAALRVRQDGWEDPLVFPCEWRDEEGRRVAWETILGDAGEGAARIESRALGAFLERPTARSSRRGPYREGRSVQELWPVIRQAIDLLPGPHRQVLWRRWGPLFAGKKPASYRVIARDVRVSLGGAWNIEQQALASLRRLIALQAAMRRLTVTQLSWLDRDSWVVKK